MLRFKSKKAIDLKLEELTCVLLSEPLLSLPRMKLFGKSISEIPQYSLDWTCLS